MRLITLVTLMLRELTAELESYFSFKENLLVLLPFFDILKSSNSFLKLRKNMQNFNGNTEYKIINVKFNFAPSVEDIISKLIKLLNSESHLISYIHDSNNIKILLLLELSGATLNFLEIIHYYKSDSNLSKHRLQSTLNRCKIAKLLLEIISRFQELADHELSHSFKIYKTLKHSSKRNELISGIIYFLFIVCFEAFTPGLNEFVRLSLKDLDEILYLNPSFSYFSPELNLIRTVLALSNRSDQYAIDCLLHLFIFDIHDLNEDFIIILKSFLNIYTHSETEIAIKLIQKFGNLNLVHLFMKSYNTLKREHLKSSIELKNRIDLETDLRAIHDAKICFEEKNSSLAQNWIKDFDNYVKFEETDRP